MIKLFFVIDVKKKCLDFVFVKGEDLIVYREFLGKVYFFFICKFMFLVERFGMDENFLDVIEFVILRL